MYNKIIKRIIVLALCILPVTAIFTGCNYDTITLISDKFTISVGDEPSNDVSDYVRASKKIIENMKLDLSNVDYNTIGEYEASVTYNDTVRKFTVQVSDLASPEIVLKNKEFYFENPGTLHIQDVVESVTDDSEFEYGFSDDMTKSDKNKNISESVLLAGNGDYRFEVLAKDLYDNYAVEEFVVHVVNEGEIPIGALEITDYSPYMNTAKGPEISSYSDFSSEAITFGVGNDTDEKNRPQLGYYTNLVGDLEVDFMQPESSFVWLTFNEVSENGNTGKILDTLKEKNVKAVFFVTLSYMKKNPELIEKMINEGHVLGNYTASCANISELSPKELTSELNLLYNYAYETYGYEMYLFRAPSGYFSEQSIAVAQNLGYRTVFWSFAYADWDAQNQPDVKNALQNALNKVHGGAIYLLSGASSTNQKMLSDMIDGIRAKGFEFGVYQKN